MSLEYDDKPMMFAGDDYPAPEVDMSEDYMSKARSLLKSLSVGYLKDIKSHSAREIRALTMEEIQQMKNSVQNNPYASTCDWSYDILSLIATIEEMRREK
jgi:hypothetical protein